MKQNHRQRRARAYIQANEKKFMRIVYENFIKPILMDPYLPGRRADYTNQACRMSYHQFEGKER